MFRGFLGLFAMWFILGSEFLKTFKGLGFLGSQALFELVQLAAQFLSAFFLGLLGAYLLDGTLDLGITGAQDFLSLVAGVMNDLAVLGADALKAFVIVGNQLVEAFLLGTNVLALVLPVATVAHDVQQILVHIDVVATHNLAGLVDNLMGQSGLARDLNGK